MVIDIKDTNSILATLHRTGISGYMQIYFLYWADFLSTMLVVRVTIFARLTTLSKML